MDFNFFGRKTHIKIEYVIIGAVMLSVAAIITGYKLITRDQGIIIEAGPDGWEEIGEGGNGDAEDAGKKDEIKVYVVGCVNKPGVVTLNRGQIIEDAIIAAGGATGEADIENINLAFSLNYNLMLKIRAKREGSSLNGSFSAGVGALIVQDSGGAVVEEPSEIGRININSATVKELDTLPGIGEATATDIVIYREQHGAFDKIEDIMNVPGIKEAKFEAIKEYIVAD